MAKNVSFDIVSDFDFQEINNAINQAKKEIDIRYDFKNSNSEIYLNDDCVQIETDNTNKLNSIVDIIKTKMIKRKLSLKILSFCKIETTNKGLVKQNINLKKGIDKDFSKKIVKIIKDSKIKVQAQIQSNTIRVNGKNIDDLQKIISLIKTKEIDIPIQFVNYK